MGLNTHHGNEHCETCAKDANRADAISAAVEIAGMDDPQFEGFETLRKSAVKLLQKTFDDYLLPKL